MFREENKIKLTLWVLAIGILASFFSSIIALPILIIAAVFTIKLLQTKKLSLKLNAKEFILISGYSLIFPVSTVAGISWLGKLGLFIAAPFFSIGYAVGSLMLFIIHHPIGFTFGLFLAIYVQVHWLYVLYRARKQVKNA